MAKKKSKALQEEGAGSSSSSSSSSSQQPTFGAKKGGKGKEREKDSSNMFVGLSIDDMEKHEEEEEEIVEEEGEKKKKKKKKKKKNNKALPYHPESGLEGAPSYFNGLTEPQTQALADLKAKLQEENLLIDRSCLLAPAETVDHFLLRFLRARSFELDATLLMVRNHLQWRKDINLQHLKTMAPEDILGCEETIIFDEIPHWLQGRDKQGRPLIFKEFGHCRVHNIVPKHTSNEKLLNYHVWCNEKYAEEIAKNSEELGVNVETFCLVVDAKGWHLGLTSKAAYAFLRSMSDVDNAQYPERLGNLVVVNAPKALAVSWAIIRGWLDKRTQQKIQILHGREEYFPVLTSLIDEEVIPVEYGGKGENLKGKKEAELRGEEEEE